MNHLLLDGWIPTEIRDGQPVAVVHVEGNPQSIEIRWVTDSLGFTFYRIVKIEQHPKMNSTRGES
jgi:hypothetical protein